MKINALRHPGGLLAVTALLGISLAGSPPAQAVTALSTEDFLNTLGVNTHLDGNAGWNTNTSQVAITGPAAICFNSLGRLVANAATGIASATCTLPTNAALTQSYQVTLSSSDRPLRINVDLGGQVHMCDPAKSLSATDPDGCP